MKTAHHSIRLTRTEEVLGQDSQCLLQMTILQVGSWIGREARSKLQTRHC